MKEQLRKIVRETMRESVLSEIESVVTEGAGKEAMGIAALTGTRGDAVQAFIDKHNLDATKLFKSIKTANLKGRLNFVSALVGHDGNPNQRLTIKLHQKNESVNEIQYKDAVAKFNDELINHPMVKKAAQHYKKTPAEIVKVLQQRLSTKGNRGGDTKEVSIDFKDSDSGINIKHKKSFNESINEEEIKWNAVENAIINFLKMNTKILDKRVKDKDTEGVKGGLQSIIDGLTNAQRSLKLKK